MITLDWDKITYAEAFKRIRYIMEDPYTKKIELRASPNLDGLHVYIESANEGGITKTWSDRRRYKDDGRRLVGDILSPRSYWRNVMFVYKTSKIGIQREIPMFKFYRTGCSNEWKCLLLTKHPLPTSLQELLL